MSGFYIGVDGKARKVKGGYIGVDGKARKIKKGYIGDENGIARLCWSGVDPVFANNTWEEIAAACQAGAVPDTWAVGDQKTMTIDGTDYAIDIIGKNHDDYADGSGKAPLTLQMHGCYEKEYSMYTADTNNVGYTKTFMRTVHLPLILSLMPDEVKAAIRDVKKLTSIGDLSSIVSSTDEKLFLLSEVEIFGKVTFSAIGEGSQYEYYSNGGSTIKNTRWWERSPTQNIHGGYCLVKNTGESYYNAASSLNGISAAFCF